MLSLILAAALVVQQDTPKAYANAATRELVRLARERRELVDASITHYNTLAKERVSMGLRTARRDRLFFRRETASRIDWQRGGPIRIDVLGAREVVPAITPKVQVPNDLAGFLPRLAYDPMNAQTLISFDTTDLRHPLADGGEAHYRYERGDSTTIDLGNRIIRLIELRVIPRRRDVHLITGSFWIDSQTHSVVQTTFRLAKDFDFEQDADPEDRRDMRSVPGFLKPIRADLEYVTMEYGLIDLRWWMPRLIAAEGFLQAGGIRTPLHYERLYEDYTVHGDTSTTLLSRAVARAQLDSINRPCRVRTSMNINVSLDENADSANVRRREERRREREAERAAAIQEAMKSDTAAARRMREADECAKRYTVNVPENRDSLLVSSELSESIFGPSEVLTSEAELTKLAERLKRIADPPWQIEPPSFNWGLGGPGLARYNKVEALSLGARTDFDFGRLNLDMTGRIGVADLEPNGELGINRDARSMRLRAAGYRRLDLMDPPSGGHSFSASLSALLFGRDEHDYFRTLGAELVGRPAETSAQWYTWRIYAEQQRAAANETDFSLRHALNDSHDFTPNRNADRADQFGASLTLRAFGGQNPASFRWNGELTVDGAGGDYEFGRASAALLFGFPLPFDLAGALEFGGGTSTGGVPAQSQFFLGGARSLRGYPIGTMAGNAFWRARAEVGTAVPLARVALFSDVGWAGDRTSINDTRYLHSAGIGASFLDGLVRLDIARALRVNAGWRLHMSLDAAL